MSRASEYRAELRRRTVVDLVAPGGATFTMRRYEPEDWITSGHVPSSVVRTYKELLAKGGEINEEAVLEDGGDMLAKLKDVQHSIICHCSIDPKISEYPTSDDELDVAEMSWADRQFLFQSLTGQLAATTVPTEGGATTVGAVVDFREGGEGQGAAGDSGDGDEVRDEAEPVAGAAGSGSGAAT